MEVLCSRMPAAAKRFAEGDSLGILGAGEVPEACRKSDRGLAARLTRLSAISGSRRKPTGTAVEDSLGVAGHKSEAGEGHSWAGGVRNWVAAVEGKHRAAVLVRGSRTLPAFNDGMTNWEHWTALEPVLTAPSTGSEQRITRGRYFFAADLKMRRG